MIIDIPAPIQEDKQVWMKEEVSSHLIMWISFAYNCTPVCTVVEFEFNEVVRRSGMVMCSGFITNDKCPGKWAQPYYFIVTNSRIPKDDQL